MARSLKKTQFHGRSLYRLHSSSVFVGLHLGSYNGNPKKGDYYGAEPMGKEGNATQQKGKQLDRPRPLTNPKP